MQANLQHARAASFVLGKTFDKELIDIALIQEPWTTTTGRVSGLGNTSGKVIELGLGIKPRSCILIRKSLKYFVLTGFCCQDVTSVQVTLPEERGTTDIIVCSAYFPGDRAAEEPPPATVRALVDHCRRNNKQLVIGCDANSHHTAWGSTDTNQRGESLFNYLLGEGLTVNNVGSEPTFVTRNRAEVLDITISSNFLSNKIIDWRVSTEPSCSDHRHIQFRLRVGSRQTAQYRDARSTNWDGYNKSLTSNLINVPTTINNCEQLEFAADQLTTAIISAYHENCPLRVKLENRKTPWWNRTLNNARREVRRLFNRAKDTGEWQEYRAALTNYNKAIRKAKTDSWKRFCEGVSDAPSSARIHKILSREPVQELGSIKRPDGTFTASRKETLMVLAETHFPGNQIIDSSLTSPPAGRVKRPRRDDWRAANEIVTPHAIRGAIKSFRPHKSPGMDGIFPALLQNGLDILTPSLIRVFRSSLAWCHIPTSWTKTRVVYIPKAGRTDRQPKSFRPISLTSFLLKSLEKVLEASIREGPLRHNPLSVHQYAYQTGKSTELALERLVTKIGQSLDNKEIALAAFIDIEGAFNNTLNNSLYESVISRGIEPLICDWIRRMLENRCITTSLQGEVVQFRAARGCPQGGVLSPLLWSLLVDNLLATIQLWGVDLQAYADDLVIVIRGKSEGRLSETLQEIIDTILAWCEREDMTINPHKITVVPFTRKRKLDHLIPLNLRGVVVPFANEVKYLGITLDKRLTWNSHLKRIKQKASYSLWTCRRICGRSWGVGPKQIYWLYIMVIRPMVTYGSVVWWEKGQQRSAQTKLNGLQRQACLAITGAFRTTPTAAMELLLGIPPLHIFLEREALKTTYRMYHTNGYQVDGKRNAEGSKLLEFVTAHGVLGMPTDLMPKTHTTSALPYTVAFPKREEWEQNESALQKADLCLFTDGSKTDSGVGAGVYGANPKTRLSIGLGNKATIFQAEVHAIEMGVRRLQNRPQTHKTIKICSDSQAALKALNSTNCNSKTVWSCQKALRELGEQNKVTLMWIPGHAGLEGNEMADLLAKGGAETDFIGPEPVLGIAHNMANQTIKTWADNKAYEHWLNLPGMTQAKAIIRQPVEKRSVDRLLELSRTKLKTLMGLYTGHCRLKHHMHRIGLVEDAECRLCMEDDETAAHILCECPAGGRLRHHLLGGATVPLGDLSNISPNTILDFIGKLGMIGEI